MRIAFIGCGGIARAHADGLAKRTDLTFADAVKTLAFTLAANRSLETGLPVEVASL